MVVQAYILIQTDVGKAAEVARAIAQVKGVTLAEDVTGPYDVIVRAEASNVDELGKLVVAQGPDPRRHHPHADLPGRAHLSTPTERTERRPGSLRGGRGVVLVRASLVAGAARGCSAGRCAGRRPRPDARRPRTRTACRRAASTTLPETVADQRRREVEPADALAPPGATRRSC